MKGFDLTGRLALVTGSGRGLGAAMARGLAEAGAGVIVHGRSTQAVAATAAEIAEATGVEVGQAIFDVTDEAAVVEGVTEVVRRHGVPDILVNNAGVQIRGPITDYSLEDWRHIVDTNLTSAFLMSREVGRAMAERGSGRIVNVGSVQSQLARPGIAPYSATKGGIVMLTKGICADLGPRGVTANVLAPGYFDTEMTRALVEDPEFNAWVVGRTPSARWGRVQDLVGPLVFLSSDASAFVNGQVLYVDGGMTSVV